MNEEVNFCSQCGSKVNSGVKFCSSCGHDLKNSSTKITSDKTIKVEVTNATVEKVFKTVGKGVKATGAILDEGVKATDEGIKATNRRLLFYLISLGKIIEGIIIISIIGAILYGVGYVGFQLLE